MRRELTYLVHNHVTLLKKTSADFALVPVFIAVALSAGVNVRAQSKHATVDPIVVEPGFSENDLGDTRNWLGLYWVAKPTAHAEVRKCVVTLGSSRADSTILGYPVMVTPAKGIIFAFRGVPNVSPGRVTTKYYRRDGWTNQVGSMDFSMSGRHYGIIVKPNDERGRSGEKWLTRGRREQFLTVWTHNFESDVTWIGDLDGDGKPDIYLSENGMGGVRDGCLYLSSIANNGSLVASVAPADGTEIRRQ